MWAKHKQQNGFTIVELLIVIVVIAILAAITIVAYNGIQNRAVNQQTVTSVRAYYSAMIAYAVDNGAYPTGNSCLGPAEFYASNPCFIGSGTYNYNAAQNTALATYITTTPTLPNVKLVGSNFTGSGIFYYPTGSYIGFPIKGTNTCPSISGATEQGKIIAGSDVYCRINFPPLP